METATYIIRERREYPAGEIFSERPAHQRWHQRHQQRG